mmetsp:Transcript_3336/g.3960  ORF Transcript_3336/g.3960 Transcript_3336/m.3960 type:complete len:85 (+) Transcript_3336:101-355(+)
MDCYARILFILQGLFCSIMPSTKIPSQMEQSEEDKALRRLFRFQGKPCFLCAWDPMLVMTVTKPCSTCDVTNTVKQYKWETRDS